MTDQMSRSIRSSQIFKVIFLFTLCAVMAACNAQEAPKTIEVFHNPSTSPLPNLGVGAMASAPDKANPVATSKPSLSTGTEPGSIPSPRPSSTPTGIPGLPEICNPYPSDIYSVGMIEIEVPLMFASCAGEGISFPSLIMGNVAIYDYTPLTGRLAYSRSLRRDLGNRAGDLWVFDFRTGKSTKWLDGGVVSASWSPDYDSVMKEQSLVIVKTDGTLDLGTEPNSFRKFANVDDVCKFSLSPLGDQITYLSDCHEISEYPLIYKGTSYIMNIHEGQMRKMAEDTIGFPIWALDHRALIIPGSPIRIYKLDESKIIPLTFANGEFINGEDVLNYIWSPSNQLLCMVKPGYANTWFAELSEDLSKVINIVPGQQTPECVRESNCVTYVAFPRGQIALMGKILALEPQSIRMNFVLDGNGNDIGNDKGYGDAEVIIGEETLFLDTQGNHTDFSALEEGMYIDFLGTSLSPDTLTLIATRIQIIGPTPVDVIYQGQISGISPDHEYATIVITSPFYESIYSVTRRLYLTSKTEVFDIEGNPITIQDLQLWMRETPFGYILYNVEIVGSSLPSEPLSIVASRITILEK